MSEELPREEGLPEESEESERWISNLFSALPEGRPNLFSLGVRAAERTEISRVRVCATCRRSLDKLNLQDAGTRNRRRLAVLGMRSRI